ncbi:MAG: response regulator transcription factor [Candidatus Sedimenticola sp. 20ELBAFRAG]
MSDIRILLADDHVMFREGLEKVLNETDGLLVSDAVSDGAEVLKKLVNQDWDVLVLDIAMSGLGGIDVLKSLKARKSSMKVLVLSMYPPEQYAIRVLKAGAAGYLTKGSSISELVSAIRQVAQGKKYINPAVASLLSDNLLGDIEYAPHEILSEREYQVMCHLAKGRTVSDVAELLSLSRNTVSTYRTRILKKMNLKNNAELAHYAVSQGLVD